MSKLPPDQRMVAQLDRYLVLKSEARDLFLRIGELLLGKRHADRVNAKMFGGVTDERAPAAADVEQAISRLQAQLAADHGELVVLRSRQIAVPVAEIGAAVDHLGIEKERIERVGKIIVVVGVFLGENRR